MGSRRIAAVTPEAVGFWRGWADMQPKTEEGLRQYVYAVINMLSELSYEENTAAIARLWDVYRYGEHLCLEEPYRSIFDAGLAHFMLTFAQNYYIEGNMREALRATDSALDFLNQMERRRERQKEGRRTFSNLKLGALATLASIKTDDPSLKDALMTPEEVIRTFWRTTTRLFKRMDELQVSARVREDAMLLLAKAELEICKLAYKYEPKLMRKAMRFFNTHHGTTITLRERHFKRPTAYLRNAWYWDWELFKLLNGPEKPKQSDVSFLDEQRRKTARLAFTGSTVHSHERLWDRQMAAAQFKRSKAPSPA